MKSSVLTEGFLDSNDVWCQVFHRRAQKPQRPALFLDRDGVIVEEVRYLHRVEDVVFLPGAAETISAANRRDIPVIIVSNQAGIGRGYYTWQDFHNVQQTVLAGLQRSGAHIDAVFACPHHPQGVGAYLHSDHPSRKPQPGMLLRAAELMNLDLRHSWIVGDKCSDLLAGRAAGLNGGMLVLTGHGPDHHAAAAALRTPQFQVLIANSILDAPSLIPSFA